MSSIKDNAFSLFKEAELLKSNGCNKRACFLLITALEEYVKYFAEKFPKKHGKKAQEIKGHASRNLIRKMEEYQEELRMHSWTPEDYSLIFDEMLVLAWTNHDDIVIGEAVEQSKRKLDCLKNEAVKIILRRNKFLYQEEDSIAEKDAEKYYVTLKDFWEEVIT